MLREFVRRMAKLLLWFVLLTAVGMLTIGAIFANYQASLSSFELLGYEMIPLGTDAYLGKIFGALFPDSTLAHFYATTMVGVLAVALFLFSHFIFQLHEYHDDRRSYLRAGESESAAILSQRMLWQVIILGALAFLLFYVLRWDVELFQYRSIAGMLGIADPQIAPLNVLTVEALRQRYPDLAATELSLSVGPYGYIAVTAISCLALEIIFRKIAEAWAQLVSPLDQWIDDRMAGSTSLENANQHYGYDENGQPVFDPNVPVAYDHDGKYLTPDSELDEHRIGEGVSEVADSMPDNVEHEVREFNEVGSREFTDQADAEDMSASVELVDVIGSKSRERISLVAALGDPEKYHVDKHSAQVWDRNHWEQLQNANELVDGINNPDKRNAA